MFHISSGKIQFFFFFCIVQKLSQFCRFQNFPNLSQEKKTHSFFISNLQKHERKLDYNP